MSEVCSGGWFGTFLPWLRRPAGGECRTGAASRRLPFVWNGRSTGCEVLRGLRGAMEWCSGVCAGCCGNVDLRELWRGSESGHKILQVLWEGNRLRAAGSKSRHDADGDDGVTRSTGRAATTTPSAAATATSERKGASRCGTETGGEG